MLHLIYQTPEKKQHSTSLWSSPIAFHPVYIASARTLKPGITTNDDDDEEKKRTRKKSKI